MSVWNMDQMLLQTTGHHLRIAKLQLELKRNWTADSCQQPRYDTTVLSKDTIKQQEFKIVLLNKSQVLEELLEEETIIEKWMAIFLN